MSVSACRFVNEGGLPGLYRVILATAGPELKSALEACPTPPASQFCCKHALLRGRRRSAHRLCSGIARAERVCEQQYVFLQLMTEAAESNETTLFFCKIGKDRTGLLAAMVLSCCGASDDEIVSDYMRCAGSFPSAIPKAHL